jgi:hypothetical protein
MKEKKRTRKRIRNSGDHLAITEQVSNCAKTKILFGFEMFQD